VHFVYICNTSEFRVIFEDDTLLFMFNLIQVEGNQTTRRDVPRTSREYVELPFVFFLERLRVYRNQRIGTVVIAHLTKNCAHDRL
jgi:hypothetical protein